MPPSPAIAGGGAVDDKILSYGDVVLRRSDLSILAGPHFINDRLIEFYFAHLAANSPSGAVLLVPPALSFLLAHFPSDPSPIAAPLRLRDRDLVLLTVNDNPDAAVPEGGSHWSLLAFHRGTNRFFHLDSSGAGSLNAEHAKRLYEVTRGLVGAGDALLEERPVPRQRNGYDCGVHVMAAARAVCQWYEAGAEADRWEPAMRGEVDRVPEMRRELLRLITELMEQQGRNV